tara:strand:+ start:831 stop:2135 length:1305 start_codon:yes stop_codon:yes gene_type:complete
VNKIPKVYMALSLEVVHSGIIYLINEASKMGELTVGLLTDKAIGSYKKLPFMSYDDRLNVLQSIKGINKIIPQDSVSYSKNLKSLKPNFIIHGDVWKNNFLKNVRQEIIEIAKEWNGKLVEIDYKSKSNNQFYKNNTFLGTTSDIRRSSLSRLLEAKSIVRVLETHSPLSALIIEKTCYTKKDGTQREIDAFWSSSLTDSATRAKPDIEAVDSSSRLNSINEIFEVTTKPLIYDADTGGKNEHLAFTVKNLERVGVSAAIIEDKSGLKRNSLFGNETEQQQETIENFCIKLESAKSAQLTNDFMVIARIESLILEKGIDDALLRAKEYIAAGADGIMIHSRKKDTKEIEEFANKYNKLSGRTYLVAVPTSYNSITENQLVNLGFNIVIYANHMLRASYPAMQNVVESILKNERSKELEESLMSIKDVINLIPLK